MDNESYNVKFNKKGLIGMSRCGDRNQELSSSGFFITFQPMD